MFLSVASPLRSLSDPTKRLDEIVVSSSSSRCFSFLKRCSETRSQRTPASFRRASGRWPWRHRTGAQLRPDVGDQEGYQPFNRRSTARIKTYPFAAILRKESLIVFHICPAVLGALSKIPFSNWESVFSVGRVQIRFAEITELPLIL